MKALFFHLGVRLGYPFRWAGLMGRAFWRSRHAKGKPRATQLPLMLSFLLLAGAASLGGLMLNPELHSKMHPGCVLMVLLGMTFSAWLWQFSLHRKQARENVPEVFDAFESRETILRERARLMKTLRAAQGFKPQRRL